MLLVNDLRKARTRLFCWGILAGGLMMTGLCLVSGCGRESGPVANEPNRGREVSHRDASPEELLKAVFTRYRNAASYHDSGQVRLSYRSQGEYRDEVAPLSVWFDRDTLYVEAYGVRLLSDPEALTAWIEDAGSGDFDSQVVRSGALRARPELEKLLADPVLAGRLSSGLAGPPPQLEWLLAAEPMERLFDGKARFEYQEPAVIGDRRCRRVRVAVDDERYVFWIDRSQGTIRRVQLPSIHSAAFRDVPAQEMRLTLELAEASFEAPASDPPVAPLPVRPQYVRRFVPLPPPEPSPLLGRRPEPFALESTDGEIQLSERGGDREVTVVASITGDPASLTTAAALQHWSSMLPEPMVRQVRTVLIVDESAREFLPREIALPVMIDRRNVAGRHLQLASGGVAILDARGQVAWAQLALAPEGLAAFGATVADVLDAVNVPQRLRDQWRADRSSYRRQLAEHSVENK